MMKNGNSNDMGQNVESPEVYAAKLSFIGSTLSTLGDGLQAIAAGIALQELEKASDTEQDSPNVLNQLEDMQQQIDYLASKIDRMERRSR